MRGFGPTMGWLAILILNVHKEMRHHISGFPVCQAWVSTGVKLSEIMALAAGSRLGPYEILAPLGVGGMGEVYRARDTRLGREVAIKISTERFTERFQREARLIASLNHPNICQLYDVGPDYLVMELIDGPTLAQRLAEGPVPLEEAIRIARQIADGLEAAHEKGIIHRDLKPGNVKIKPDGSVKVLDFGLAKVGGTPTATADESPTITLSETKAGVILGTASYMSPEQVRGKDVDKRADIWAFGVVLYEMLTGKRLFRGETVGDTLAAVLKEQPDLDAAPAGARRILRRCLEKDPKRRLRDIGDAAVELDEILNAVPEAATAKHSLPTWARAIVGFLVLALAAGAGWTILRPKPDPPMFQMEIIPPDGVRFLPGLTPFALSPDGHRIAFVAAGRDGKQMLWLRSIDSTAASPVAGTENAEIPFWSPDSRWLGFSANSKLQKIDVVGGSLPQIICDIQGRAGGTWNRDGVIVFDQGDKPLLRVSANGGTPTPILQLDARRGEKYHGGPFFLPDGRHVLYYSASRNGNDLMVASLDGRENRLLIERGGVPLYASNPSGGGAILYNQRGQLIARPFDSNKLEFTGQPAVLADGVFLARWWYASATGLLAFRHTYGTQYQLAWFGRDGKMLASVGAPGRISAPRVSPDQKTVAFWRQGEANSEVWTFDATRNAAAPFTFGPRNSAFPTWSSDGKDLIYTAGSGPAAVVARPASGVGEETPIAARDGNNKVPTAVTRDGLWLVYTEMSALHGVMSLQSLKDPHKVIHLQDHDRETDGSISPDGRWLLYSSVPAGRREVLVQSVPKEAGGSATAVGKWQISTGGGAQPAIKKISLPSARHTFGRASRNRCFRPISSSTHPSTSVAWFVNMTFPPTANASCSTSMCLTHPMRPSP
jgi:eukaryotic-like serine/threonine-protein kinase